MRLVVTDGESRAALAITRTLGRAGHEVHVCSSRPYSLAGLSRWCAGEHPQASPEAAPDTLAGSIAAVARVTTADRVVGVTDRTLVALHQAAPDLGPARMPDPDRQTYESASDKIWLAERSREWSIPVPDGFAVPGGSLPDPARLETLGETWVARPAVSWRHDGRRWVEGRVRLVNGLTELRSIVAEEPAFAFPYLVQRRIRGAGCGLFLSAHQGKIQAVFAHERIREKPPWGGVSTLCRSVHPPADLVAAAERFVDRAAWSGLAMLEFKRDDESGVAYLLEINARPWGSISLPLTAGVDFVRAWLEPEHPAPASGDYRENVRLRWWWGDVDHFYLREKETGAKGVGAMVRALGRATLAGPRAEAWDTFRRDDPLPFAGETLRWLGHGG